MQPARTDGLATGGAPAVVSRREATQRALDLAQPAQPASFRLLGDRLSLHGIHSRKAADAGLVELDRLEIVGRRRPRRFQLGLQRNQSATDLFQLCVFHRARPGGISA